MSEFQRAESIARGRKVPNCTDASYKERLAVLGPGVDIGDGEGTFQKKNGVDTRLFLHSAGEKDSV